MEPLDPNNIDIFTEQFSQVPDEILEHIFTYIPIKYLRNVMAVDHRWYNIINNEAHWQIIFEILFPEQSRQLSDKQNSHLYPDYWKKLLQSQYGWSKFSNIHKAPGLSICDEDRSVYSDGNRAFAPILVKNPIHEKVNLLEIEFFMNYISSEGYTGIGIATDDLIDSFSTKKFVITEDYLGHYNGPSVNAGYFENGYMSLKKNKGIWSSDFFDKYSTGDRIKMVIDMISTNKRMTLLDQ